MRRALHLLATLALLALAAPAAAEQLTGRVVAIADGDTLTVLDAANRQHRVRLAGIDAPEKRQPYGEAARELLARLAFGRTATILWHKTDRYGRIVGKVMVDARDANLALLDAGLAWHYKRYQHEQSEEDRRRYAASADAARERRLGLWREPHPTPPWAWRARASADPA